MRVLALGLALAAAGCGSSAPDIDAFVGAWTATGSVVTRCGTGPGNSSNLNETITITKGVGAPLLVVVGDCSLQMDVNGDVASVRPGQMCKVSRNNVTTNATYGAGTFTAMGIKATFDLSASFTVGEGALVLSCTYTATGNAAKVPK
jgi:hypothetical protein